jgi:hypothetical protein
MNCFPTPTEFLRAERSVQIALYRKICDIIDPAFASEDEDARILALQDFFEIEDETHIVAMMIHIIRTLHASHVDQTAAYTPLTDHPVTKFNDGAFSDDLQALLYFKMGIMFSLPISFSDNKTQQKAAWNSHTNSQVIFATIDPDDKTLHAKEKAVRDAAAADFQAQVDAQGSIIEQDSVHLCGILSKVCGSGKPFEDVYTLVNALATFMAKVFGYSCPVTLSTAAAILCDKFMIMGGVPADAKSFETAEQCVLFICTRTILRMDTNETPGGMEVHPWGVDRLKVERLVKAFWLLGNYANVEAAATALMLHWNLYFLEDEQLDDWYARIFYHLLSKGCERGAIAAAVRSAFQGRRGVSSMSAATFAGNFTFPITPPRSVAPPPLPSMGRVGAGADGVFDSASVGQASVTHTSIAGHTAAQITPANASAWQSVRLMDPFRIPGFVAGVTSANLGHGATDAAAAPVIYICQFGSIFRQLSPAEVLIHHNAFRTAANESAQAGGSFHQALAGANDMSRIMHGHRHAGLGGASAIDIAGASFNCEVPGTSAAASHDVALSKEALAGGDSRLVSHALTLANAMDAIAAGCTEGKAADTMMAAAALKNPNLHGAWQNIMLQVRAQTKGVKIYAGDRSLTQLQSHKYGSANIELYQPEDTAVSKAPAFTADIPGFFMLREAIRLFGKMHLNKTVAQTEGFVWLLDLLDTHSPVSARDTDVRDIIDLVKVMFIDYQKQMHEARVMGVHPSVYPTLKTLSTHSKKVRDALELLVEGKKSRMLLARSLTLIASGGGLTSDLAVNAGLRRLRIGTGSGAGAGSGSKGKRANDTDSPRSDLAESESAQMKALKKRNRKLEKQAKQQSGKSGAQGAKIKEEKSGSASKATQPHASGRAPPGAFRAFVVAGGRDGNNDRRCFNHSENRPCAPAHLDANGVCKFSHAPADAAKSKAAAE